MSKPEIDLDPHEWRLEGMQPAFGSPLDFGPSVKTKRRKEANPLIWGAWGGIVATAIATCAAFAHQLGPSQTVWGFGMGGLFWMGAVARIWNWLGQRP